MDKIFETKDYKKFELLPFNRDVKGTKYLEQSMREHGWIAAYPMHVVPNGNGKLKIKSGHHRFEVARKIGIPVKYIVCEDNASIYELERGKRNWSLEDYAISFSRAGNKNYIKVLDFHKETGISYNQCVSMLGGESAGSGNLAEDFKNGYFTLGNPTHAYTVADIVCFCDSLGIQFAKQRLFVAAISKIIWVYDVSIEELKHKIKTHPFMVTKQPNTEMYIRMLEDVYNRQRSKKVPVFFLCDELAKKRNPVARKNK